MEPDPLESEQELGELVALVLHDLRGPLASAKIAAQLLAKDLPDPLQRHALAVRVVKNLGRMERMIHDLLDAEHVRAGHGMQLQLEECDSAAIARDVVEDLRAVHHAWLLVHREPSLVGIWSAEHLRRALWNLASNAIKYGTVGKAIDLVVEKDTICARLSVHNHGNPISPEDQATLFERFVRTKAAKAGNKRGWGLGLTLVRGCAEAHGGRVLVKSDDLVGTTFTLELPLGRVNG